MITCVFYSYKGGVGRTTALANVAELCYQAGLKVLMVDWDLEAPGLERFFTVDKITDKPGLMDLLLEYKNKMAKRPSEDKEENANLPFKSIEPFVVNIYPNTIGHGQLLLLTAGRHSKEHFAEYANSILTFDWQDFYENWEGERFFEWLRWQWKDEFDPDIVLIDSRTGVTEIGGVCIYQLADVVVMLTSTNNQNLEGTDLMGHEFTRPAVKVHRNGRPLEVIVVPAKVETIQEGTYLNNFKEDFLSVAERISVAAESVLKKEIFWDIRIPYIPFYAFKERVAVRERDQAIAESMVTSFERLCRAITRVAPKYSSLKRAFGSDDAFDASYAHLVPYPYDVFVSYNYSDYEWVRNWLIPNLEGANRKVSTDRELLNLGKRMSNNLMSAITNSRYTLLVLTPQWITNEWPLFQTLLANPEDRNAILQRIIPVLRLPCKLPSPLSELAYANFTNETNNKEEFSKLLDALRGAPRLPPVVNNTTLKSSRRADWGEAPEGNIFFGRTRELEILNQWILEDHCRLVAIVGLRGVGKTRLSVKLGKGGIGKTDLSLKLARGIQDQFEYVIWQRLLNAPKLTDVLANLIKFLSEQQEVELPESIDDQITRLLFYLQEHRCLLIFDNAETILEGGKQTGQYREGYEKYGQLFRQIAEASHQSCLLLTSREKPQDIALLEGKTRPVRSLELGGLDYENSKNIFATYGEFQGSEENWQELTEFYNGNPLALELAAKHIQSVFSSDIAAFLKEHKPIFSDLRELLAWHITRLNNFEKEVMYWLAINREPMSLTELKEDILSPIAKTHISSTLDLLQRSVPLEKVSGRFTLQPVLIEYMTEQLVEHIIAEIEQENIDVFNNYALLKALTKDYVRESQIRLILEPAIQPFLMTKDYCERKLKRLLTALRSIPLTQPGYATGNILNCLIQINADLRGVDCSHLPVWQAYLRETSLIDANFAYTDLAKSVFTDIFGSILSVAFSPDATKLAAGTDTGEVRIWRVRDGNPLVTFLGHTDWVWGIAFSPDGNILASGSSDQTIRLWDMTGGQCIHILRGHSHRIRSVTFSRDGTQLASASEDHTIRIWDVDSGHLLHTLEGHTNPVRSIAFTPDGEMLVSGSDDHTVRIWNIAKEQCINILHGHSSQIWSLALSNNGKVIASGSDDSTVRTWDMATGECLKILKGHTNCIYSLAFTPDGTILASGSADGTVRLWNSDTGQPLNTLQGHKNWIISVSFSRDGKMLASGSQDQTVRLWETNTGHCLMTLQGYSNGVRSVAFSPQGILLASGDRMVRLWSAEHGHSIAKLQGHSSRVRTLAFSPDGILLASGSDDQTARIWEVRTAQLLHTLQGHTNRVKSIAFSPDGTLLVSGSDDHTVRLWDVKLGRPLKILRGHTNRIRSVAFSPGGNVFASGSDDWTAQIWDTQTDQCISILKGHTNRVWSIVFSPDGQLLASGSEDRTVRIWEVSTGQCLHVLQGHTNSVWSIAFSADGTMLASSSEDRTVRIWEVSTGQCLHILQGHTNTIWTLAFSPDSKILASGSHDNTIRLWESHSGTNLVILRGHTDPVWALAFSPDSKTLASSSDDGTCRLWDVEQGECRNILESEKPYERMNITGVKGLSESQKAVLLALGAIEDSGIIIDEILP